MTDGKKDQEMKGQFEGSLPKAPSDQEIFEGMTEDKRRKKFKKDSLIEMTPGFWAKWGNSLGTSHIRVDS